MPRPGYLLHTAAHSSGRRCKSGVGGWHRPGEGVGLRLVCCAGHVSGSGLNGVTCRVQMSDRLRPNTALRSQSWVTSQRVRCDTCL